MKIESIVNFLKVIEQFKTCERTCRTTDNSRPESDAEHTWHLATFLLLLEDDFEDIDFNKVLKIALIHDLPEIFAGDTNPYRGDTSNKEENEKQAAQKLFSLLPDNPRRSFEALFQEYLEQNTIESQIVKSADKLMPLIQNICTNKTYSSYRELEVQHQEVKDYMDSYFQSDGILRDFYTRLLDEAKRKGVFYS
ncbi:MAG: HD domain-containing protein [Proteobacteria bacterium]|nr:HD domain-containing protein [Pseudomonadota bacterium]